MVGRITIMTDHSKISALVINLDHATKRWGFQQKQLDKLGLPYQRWQATAVSSLTDAEYEKWANDWQRKLRRTEVACFLSHYRVWQYIATAEKPFLVLEDDAILSKDLPVVLNKLHTSSLAGYHHLTFETRGRKKLIGKQIIDAGNTVSLNHLFLDKTGAAAYLLTPEGAKILLNQVDKHGAGLADALLCHTKSLKSMQSVPALAIQMDMAEHYDMPKLRLDDVATSNISTPDNTKPPADGAVDKVRYKSRRISAQLAMGITQLKHSSGNCYQEVMPHEESFEYLYDLISD